MSPTILREKGYRFFFFSREEMRMHIHVQSENGEAKFWLTPKLELARNFRLSGVELREAEEIIEAHYDDFATAWEKHFGA